MFAAESPVLNQDKTVDFSPASKPVPNELGKLIIMKKEGGEGASMDITTEITIGRDKECDIRIKLNSISRQHARIYVDENGEYYFQHLSKTNPSLVNGLSVKETHHLKDGDLLTFGDRQIKFSRPSSRTLKQFSASKLLSVDKHIPSLETIDEGHTFDFSKVQSNSSSSSVSPVKLNLTSLCKAETEAVESIQEEEAVVVETEAPHSVPVAAASQVTSPTPAPVSAELKRKTSSSVNTPTRQAIKALRKSYGATPATNNSDVSGESVEAPMSSRKTPAKSPRKNSSTPQNDTQEKEEAVKEVEEEAEELNEVEEISREEKKRITAAINTPTRKAIQALRRSSTGGEADLTTCAASEEPSAQTFEPKTEMAQTEVTAFAASEITNSSSKKMKQSLSTPVKNAIKAMRKSYSAPLTAAPVPAPVTSSSEQIASRPQALKTPLKKAIQALRKTNENTEAAATPAPSTVIKTPAGRKRSRLSEAAAVPLPITPAAASAEREASAVTSSKKKKLAVSPSLANIKSPLSVISEAAAGAKEISEASEPEVEVKEVKTEQVDEQAVDCPAQPSETEAAPALETKSEVEEVAAAEPVKKVKKAPTTKKPAGKKAKAETEDEVIAEEKIEATEVVKDAVASPAAENQATLNETGAKEVEEKEKVVAAPVIIAVSPVKQNKTAGGKKKGKSTANTAMAEEPVVFVQSVVLPVVEEPIQTAVSAATAGGRKRKQQPKADEEEVVKKQQQMAAVPEVEEPAAPEPVKTSRRGAKATPVTSTALPTVEDTAAAVEPPVTKRSRKAMAAAPESAPAVPPAASAVAPVKKGKKAAAPVLQEDEEEALAILCDGCDKEYFVDEVGLTSVPKGDWFCVKCVEKSSKKGGKTKAAAATAEPAATKGRTRRG